MTRKEYLSPIYELRIFEAEDVLTGSQDDSSDKEENKEYWTGHF